MSRLLVLVLVLASTACVGVAKRVDYPTFENGSSAHTRRRAAPVADYTVDDLAWLAGQWTGTSSMGPAEETWSTPLFGEMIGTFRVFAESPDGELAPFFYELLTLVEEDGLVKMKLKHFWPGELEVWEDNLERTTDFQLVEITDVPELGGKMACFGGLTLLSFDDQLVVFVAMSGNPDTDELLFTFDRTLR